MFVLRHAQSRHNAYKIEEPDTDLSELGVEQASSIDCDRAFDTVVCSPLRRCRKTLELSGIEYNKLIIEPLAREHLLWESDTLPGETFSGKEPTDEFVARIKKLRLMIHEVLKTTDSLLLVAHFYTIKYLTSLDSNGELTREGLEIFNAEMAQCELQ